MRLSSDKNSEHYWLLHFPDDVDIFFNGEISRAAIEADDVEGWIRVVEEPLRWVPVRGHSPDGATDEAATVVLQGKVEFRHR